MKLETGNPRTSGHYAVYSPGEQTARGVVLFVEGNGWAGDRGEISAWVGPLPLQSIQRAAPVSFDL